MNRTLLLLPIMAVGLSSCTAIDETGQVSSAASRTAADSAPSFGQPLTVETVPGGVTIREGARELSSIRSARPNVEQTRWYSEQEQIVVKSRGNHGPATVELFDSSTGRLLGTVMAYEAANGPAWAVPMAE